MMGRGERWGAKFPPFFTTDMFFSKLPLLANLNVQVIKHKVKAVVSR